MSKIFFILIDKGQILFHEKANYDHQPAKTKH